MTDIFLSYSSKDKHRVAPLCDQLTALGYSVFWDQQVPAGCDWDTWIRQQLFKSKCAIVVWSQHSVASGNVRHEATVAEKVGKLIPVLIDPLTPDQFPMGLYNVQAANLVDWAGETSNAGWAKLRAEVEAKIKPHAPLWLQNTIHGLEVSLMAEKARVLAAESRGRSLEAKIGGDASAVLETERERTRAFDEVAALKIKLDQEVKARAALIEQGRALEEKLAQAAKDQQALRHRLGIVTAGGEAKLQGSRGHLGWTDLIAWVAVICVLIAFQSPAFRSMGDSQKEELPLIAAAVFGGWFLIVLIRRVMQRRVGEVSISSITPVPPPPPQGTIKAAEQDQTAPKPEVLVPALPSRATGSRKRSKWSDFTWSRGKA